jgi:hypothetical protein
MIAIAIVISTIITIVAIVRKRPMIVRTAQTRTGTKLMVGWPVIAWIATAIVAANS